jgi:hypothetical protein
MTFSLNTRIYWKNVRQGDEKAGKSAQNLSSNPLRQEIRASTGCRAVDKGFEARQGRQ